MKDRLTQIAVPISVLRTGGGVEVDDRVDPVFGALFFFFSLWSVIVFVGGDISMHVTCTT